MSHWYLKNKVHMYEMCLWLIEESVIQLINKVTEREQYFQFPVKINAIQKSTLWSIHNISQYQYA